MTGPNQIEAYRFLSEVLLYPEERDPAKLAAHAKTAAAWTQSREPLEALLADPQLDDCGLYLETFECEPKVPLYLGYYLFKEPNSCRGAALSDRNAYMIQLKNLYRHFGFELHGGELPDFLPLMLEFLALTAEHPARKHRRLLVKQFMAPALPAFTKGLREAANVYSPLADLLEQLLNREMEAPAAPAVETAATAGH